MYTYIHAYTHYTYTVHIHRHTCSYAHIIHTHIHIHVCQMYFLPNSFPFSLLLFPWLFLFPSVLTSPWSRPLLSICLLPFFTHMPYSHLLGDVSLPWILCHWSHRLTDWGPWEGGGLQNMCSQDSDHVWFFNKINFLLPSLPSDGRTVREQYARRLCRDMPNWCPSLQTSSLALLLA